MVNILNVGEKPSQAKTIAFILAKGSARSVQSLSKFNPVWNFDCQIQGQQANMYFTSLSGHLMNHEFPEQYSNWQKTDPALLLKEARVDKKVSKSKHDIANNIKKYAADAQKLIVWTDCDREGENMAYEIVEQAKQSNRNIQVLRGQFSSMEASQIYRAINNLTTPDKQQSDAVDARSEIDLRIGAAFTRFQSLSIRFKFIETSEVVSYGPCQFPTMGFVVDRYREIRDFKSEQFWHINMKYEWIDKQQNKQITNFNWDRSKIFDEQIATELYLDSFTPVEGDEDPVPLAKVIDIKYINKQKFKPYPLTTVMLSKRGTGILRTSGSSIMDHAEKLYQKGFISYPRTETNVYPHSMTDAILKGFIEQQKQSNVWGNYASLLVDNNQYQRPGNGKQDDKAHPPIHPIKYMPREQAENDLQYKVYELIVRYFLGCCSKNAQGDETTMTVAVKDEIFVTKGLVIKEYNYLEIFIYDKWGESSVPNLQLNQQFFPSIYMLEDSKTTPPKLLTEGELIGLMEKNGIGTDATMNEHIKKVQERKYIQKNNQYFSPSALGVALVEVYESLHHPLGLPDLRSWMETLFKEICEGQKTKEAVIQEVMEIMITIFKDITQKKQDFFDYMCDKLTSSNGGGGGYGGDGSSELIKQEQFGNCKDCSQLTYIYTGHQRKIGCENCNIYLTIPKNGELQQLNDICPLCQYKVIKIQTPNSAYTLCPHCYTNPPQEYRIQDNYMACYKCLNTSCNLATGFLNQMIFKCPSCKSGEIKIKQTKDKSKYFIGCSKFPTCKFSIFLSSDIIKITPETQQCEQCTQKNIKSQMCKVTLKNNYQCSQNMLMLIDTQNLSLDNLQVCFYPNCDRLQEELGYSLSQQINNNNSNNNNTQNRQRSNTFTQNTTQQQNLGRTLTNNLNTLSLKNKPPLLKNRNQSAENNNNNFLNNKSNTTNTFKCFKCGDPSHMANKCPQQTNQFQQQNGNKGTNACFKCGDPNHFSNKCPQINNNKNNNNNNNQFQKTQGNACFKCGDPNHFANKCPQAKDNNNNNNYNNNNNNFNQNKSKGCKVCGKARHGKNDNCPGKKTYTKKNMGDKNFYNGGPTQQEGGINFEM